jgi:uncharacterized protein
MQYKRLNQDSDLRSYAIVLDTGEEVMGCLQKFVTAEQISAAQIAAIRAFSDVVLMYFDWETKDYLLRTSHLVVVGKRTGAALAGHLAEGHVRPTLEVIVTESPTYLRKDKRNSTYPAASMKVQEQTS